MSSKDRYGKFKKKHYVHIAKATVSYLCDQFGYKIKPLFKETKLPRGALMMFGEREEGYVIFYDYKNFKDMFGELNGETQELYVAGITAHEMRHYYQRRQMYSLHPKEKRSTLRAWWKNRNNPKSIEDGCSFEEYSLQPLEVDAFLFEYVFCAEEFGKLPLFSVNNHKHFKAMEKLYIQYNGKTNKDLFPKKIFRFLQSKKAG